MSFSNDFKNAYLIVYATTSSVCLPTGNQIRILVLPVIIPNFSVFPAVASRPRHSICLGLGKTLVSKSELVIAIFAEYDLACRFSVRFPHLPCHQVSGS